MNRASGEQKGITAKAGKLADDMKAASVRQGRTPGR